MIPVFLAALLQAVPWTANSDSSTVGDTLWLYRQIPVEVGAHARLEPLERTDVIEPLRDPLATVRDGLLSVRYALAVFRPGRVGVSMPSIEVQYADGRTVTVPGDTVWLVVTSVLPQLDPPPDPQPSLAPVPRRATRLLPLVLLVGLTLLSVSAWGIRRRWPTTRPVWAVPSGEPGAVPDERWAELGEPRAAAANVADRLRRRIADGLPAAGRHLNIQQCLEVIGQERPDWPRRDLEGVLRALERARFAPAVANDLQELRQRAETLVARLGAEDEGASE
jgi:hypothetical protein